jgi:hypothetical protein
MSHDSTGILRLRSANSWPGAAAGKKLRSNSASTSAERNNTLAHPISAISEPAGQAA